MKLKQMEKISYRLDCITQRLGVATNEFGETTRHDWKKYKFLLTGKFKPSIGVSPIYKISYDRKDAENVNITVSNNVPTSGIINKLARIFTNYSSI